MGKPKNNLHKSKGRDTKKGENSTKSQRTRKTDWSEQSDCVVKDLLRLDISDSESEAKSGRHIKIEYIKSLFNKYPWLDSDEESSSSDMDEKALFPVAMWDVEQVFHPLLCPKSTVLIPLYIVWP